MGPMFRWLVLMSLLSASILWPMAKMEYNPKYSTAVMIWSILLIIGVLVIDTILLAWDKDVSFTGKIWRGLLVIPYAVFSVFCAISLAQITLIYLSDPAQSIWLKIIIGIVNLAYTIGCLYISVGVIAMFASEETGKAT